MAQTNTQRRFKETISAIRTVVPNRSNNEITLVLQHFENNVDKTVQAFVDGSAVMILREWNTPGKKKHNKKRKSKPKLDSEGGKDEQGHRDLPESAVELPGPKDGLNGYHGNGSANDDSSADSLSETLETGSNPEKGTVELELHRLQIAQRTVGLSPEGEKLPPGPVIQSVLAAPKSQPVTPANKPKARTPYGVRASTTFSPATPGDSTSNKKRGPYIEKSVKDLQRCTVALARYQLLIKEEMDASVKKIKITFAELQTCIMDREVTLMSELDKVKKEALEILDSRQRRAEELKRLTDSAVQMSESQLAELRAEIKHFVSDRKYDEELGRSARFTGSPESLGAQIQQFGEVSHPKNNYSTRAQCVTAQSSSSLKPQGTVNTTSSVPTSLNALSFVSQKGANANIQKVSADKQNYQRGAFSVQQRGFNPRAQGLWLNGASVPGRSDDGRIRGRKGPAQDGNRNHYQNRNAKSKNQGSSHNPAQPLLTDSRSVLPAAESNIQSAHSELATTVSVVLTERVTQYRSCPIKQDTSVDTKALPISNRMTVVA